MNCWKKIEEEHAGRREDATEKKKEEQRRERKYIYIKECKTKQNEATIESEKMLETSEKGNENVGK